MLTSATVNVYEDGTTTPIAVTMYDSAAGGGTLANPLTTDSVNGEIEFWLDEPRRVDLKITKSGYTTRTVTVDVSDSGDEEASTDVARTFTATQTFTRAHTKLAPWVDVKAYGALGDGATDDYTAINSAIAALTDGSTLFLPPGTYISSDKFSLQGLSNITVIGYGATISFSKAATNSTYYFTLGDFTDTTRETNIKVYGLTLTYNRAVSTTTTDVLTFGVRYANNVVVKDVTVLRSDLQGLYVTNCNNVRIESCVVGSQTAGGADRIHGDGIFTHGNADVVIANNQVGNSKDDGIFHEPTGGGVRTNNMTITGNIVSNVDIGAGIRIQSVSGLTISGNVIRNTGDPAIDISEESTFLPSINFTIANNTIIDAGQHANATGTAKDGIYAAGCDYGTITGNTIRNFRRHGILLSKGTNGGGLEITVSGNMLLADADGDNNSGNGIQTTNMTRCMIFGNYIFNTNSEGILCQNTSADDTPGIIIKNNTLANIKKDGAVGTVRAIYLYQTSTGNITSSLLDGNAFMDSRAGPITDYCYRVDASNVVQVGWSNSWTNIPITDNAGQNFAALVPVKAGTIGDADFPFTPSGTFIGGIDTTNGRLYVRYGGAWHYATLT